MELDWTWFCGKNIIRSHPNTVYWCAYSDDISNIQTGETPVGLTTTSGQSNIECFDSQAERDTRVKQLKAEE